MTDREKFMYEILGRISSTDAPIVFKGGLVTKLILEERGFGGLSRMTKDIDANWVDSPPSMSVLTDTINRSLGDLQNLYVAEASREHGEKRSACISIKDRETGDEVISIDIDMKPLLGRKTYYCGETCFQGVLPNEILTDKISSISSDAVYKHRAKDLVDVFALAHCMEVNSADIYETCEKTGRSILSFDGFYHRKDDVEYAYNKLRGISEKPDFRDVYAYIADFTKPFYLKDHSNQVWNCEKSSWEEDRQKTATMEDYRTMIAAMRIANQKDKRESHEKRKDDLER